MYRILRRIQRRLLRLLGIIFYVPLLPFRFLRRTTGQFFALLGAWWSSRPLRDLLFGMPALLLLLTAGVLAASNLMTEPARMRRDYSSAGEEAFRREDYKTARLFFERAVDLGENDNDTLYHLAECYKQVNDHPREHALIQELAPEDFERHAPAHLRVATERLAAQPLTKEDVAGAEKHLGYVLNLRPQDPDAHRLLGELSFQRQEWSVAAEHFKNIYESRPEYGIMISRAYAIEGNSRAPEFAERARDIFLKRISDEPEVATNYTFAADACLLLEDYPQAVELLAKAIQVDPENSLNRFGLGRVYVLWADSHRGETRQQRAVQLELYSAALLVNPDEAQVYNGLIRILQAGDETAEQAQEFLAGRLAEGKSVGLCHMLLATLAESQGDLAKCELHLGRAYEMMPNASIVANNLAWILAMKEDPEPQRALVLINSALEKSPGVKRFLDTRGQILVKLGNWKQALADLELTLPEFANKAATHVALAKCYENLGDAVLAKEHQRVADLLEHKLATPSPNRENDSPLAPVTSPEEVPAASPGALPQAAPATDPELPPPLPAP